MAEGDQTDRTLSLNVDLSDLITALKMGNLNSAMIAQRLTVGFADRAAPNTRLAIAFSTAGGTGTLVSSSPGYLKSISVTTASTGTLGMCYDSASPLNAGSTNPFMVISSSGLQVANWPFQNGLVVQPSSMNSHTVAVSYI